MCIYSYTCCSTEMKLKFKEKAGLKIEEMTMCLYLFSWKMQYFENKHHMCSTSHVSMNSKKNRGMDDKLELSNDVASTLKKLRTTKGDY